MRQQKHTMSFIICSKWADERSMSVCLSEASGW